MNRFWLIILVILAIVLVKLVLQPKVEALSPQTPKLCDAKITDCQINMPQSKPHGVCTPGGICT